MATAQATTPISDTLEACSPRVDPRVRRTRQQLLEAFNALLQGRGFQHLTVQDIAERADINRGTFYAHFPSKHALMDNLIREQVRAALLSAIPCDAAVTRANLHALTRTICEYLASMQTTQCRPSDHTQIEPMIEVAVQEELRAYLNAWLPRLPRPTSPPELSTPLAVTVMSWAIFGAGMEWSRGPRDVPADTIAWQIVTALLKGMPSALGQAGRLT